MKNICYTYVDNKTLEYITGRKYTDFLISEYIMSNDSELSFDNINILNRNQTNSNTSYVNINHICIYIFNYHDYSQMQKIFNIQTTPKFT